MFDKVIKKRRNELGMTQAELGSLLNLKANTISSYESGTRKPRHEDIIKLCVSLKIDPNELYGFKK